MIIIKDKSYCCGCSACAMICPKNCIAMRADNEGFLYPMIDRNLCIDCGLCEKVCPFINNKSSNEIPEVYAAINNKEEIRLRSSSGGIFTLLAENVIDKGGVVFGARFDKDWNVVHDYTETKEGLEVFRGSKYVQSYMGDSYVKVKRFLEQGREVLFSGTPCQTAGLKNFLRKPYVNLLSVDLVCHGVPAPRVWQSYLKENRKSNINNISFRSKSQGWKKYSFCLEYNDGIKKEIPSAVNPYMNIFLSDLSLRPSCYNCRTKMNNSIADITLADYWGVDKINPSIDDDKGCSLVLVKNKEKINLFENLNCRFFPQKLENAVKYNPSLVYSVNKPLNRDFFFAILRMFGFSRAYTFATNKSRFYRLMRYIYRKV